ERIRSGAILSSGSAGATNAKQPAMDLRRQAERPSRAGRFRIGRNAGSGGGTRQAELGCRVPTYRAALEPGEVMPGWGLGEVVESKYGYPHGRFWVMDFCSRRAQAEPHWPVGSITAA